MKQYLKNTFWLGLLGALVLIFLATTGKDAEAGVRDISNLNWKPSVYKGKKYKPYEIVKAKDGEPAIGKRSFKFTVMPYDCGGDHRWSDCNAGQKRARSEIGAWESGFTGKVIERWFSYSIYVPEDFKSVYPTATSFFQVYKKSKNKKSLGPIVMLRDQGLDRLVVELHGTEYADYYCPGCTSVISGNRAIIKISDMKGKWTHFKVHFRYTDKKDGFWKFYVNDELKYHVAGKTKGLIAADMLYLKAGLYQTGTERYERAHNKLIDFSQTIYIDSIYQAKTEEKLLKLINKSK